MRRTGLVKKTITWAAGFFMSMGLIASANAQTASAARPDGGLDLAVTYTSSYAGLTSGSNNFWLQGGSAELSATFWHGLGEVANVTGLHNANSGEGVPVNVVTATFGPRYSWTLKRASPHNLRVFGEALAGIANGFSGLYPQPGGASDSANSLALQIGGGANYSLNRHFALRLIQANWLRTQLPNATTGVQNNLILGAGVVFRIK